MASSVDIKEVKGTRVFLFCFSSGCFICVFALLIHKVCLQVTVEGVNGGSVVLPCSSTQHDLKLQDVSVHWRHNNSEIVYDIIKGGDVVSVQNPRYKNRAETFPDEYLRGNFSIKLNNLQHTDGGTFSCLITPSNEQETIQLNIKELTAGKGNKSIEQANQGSAQTTTVIIICVVVILLVLILISAMAYFMFHRRRRFQAAV
uniref:Ig-like domain-containing protein n=1 Tax=Cyprinus carpio carpio TaxID=630221 RepID=A0A9J7YDG0_CYPCA